MIATIRMNGCVRLSLPGSGEKSAITFRVGRDKISITLLEHTIPIVLVPATCCRTPFHLFMQQLIAIIWVMVFRVFVYSCIGVIGSNLTEQVAGPIRTKDALHLM